MPNENVPFFYDIDRGIRYEMRRQCEMRHRNIFKSKTMVS